MCDPKLARKCKKKHTCGIMEKTGFSLIKEKLNGREISVISFTSFLALPNVQASKYVREAGLKA